MCYPQDMNCSSQEQIVSESHTTVIIIDTTDIIQVDERIITIEGNIMSVIIIGSEILYICSKEDSVSFSFVLLFF